MNITDITALAADARPIDDSDWGSDRQIEAENRFHEALKRVLGETPEYDDWCLKATSVEIIDEGLRMVTAALASRDA